MSRDLQDCPHRVTVAADKEFEASHSCQLLKTLSGVHTELLCRVSTELCHNCCRFITPDADRLNPVFASRLYELSGVILRDGGVDGCDARQAEILKRRTQSDLVVESESDPGVDSTTRKTLLPRLISMPWWKTPKIASWSVGITTARRSESTLARCVDSVVHAGWSSPRLFIDGRVALPESCRSLPVTTRDTAVGAWPNYYLGLAELILRDPMADAYLLLQDDALLCPCSTLRPYLESVLWPANRDGVASLYCSRAYTRSRPGWYRYRRVWKWGALAFVFSRRAAQQFLYSRYVIKHRWRLGSYGRANVDGVIGRWARRDRIPLYYPTPSLVQHIGETSTIWPTANANRERQASWFALDADELP